LFTYCFIFPKTINIVKKIIFINIIIILAMTAHSQNADDRWTAFAELTNHNKVKEAYSMLDDIRQEAITLNDRATLFRVEIETIRLKNEHEEDELAGYRYADSISMQWNDAPYYNILCVAKGFMLGQYVQFNRYKLSQRATIGDADNLDIEQWSESDFQREITSLFRQILRHEPQKLLRTPAAEFDYLPSQSTKIDKKTTLADYLAHVILSNLSGSNTQYFDLLEYNPKLLQCGRSFINQKIDIEDTLNGYYQKFRTLQEIMRMHYAAPSPDYETLFMYELLKLDYHKETSLFENELAELEQSMYYVALNNLQKAYPGDSYQCRIEMLKAEYFLRLGDEYQHSSPETTQKFQPYKKKALDTYKGILQKPCDSSIRTLAEKGMLAIKQPSASIMDDIVNIPDKPIPLSFQYENISTLNVSVYSTTASTLKSLESHYISRESLLLLLKDIPTRQFTVQFPATNDYQSHTTEVVMDGLPVGYYFIVLHDQPDIMQSKILDVQARQISNLKVVIYNNENGDLDLYVVNATTGEPVANADVTVTRNGKKTNSSTGKTDPTGLYHHHDQTTGYHNFTIKVQKGNDQITTQSYHNHYTSAVQEVLSLFTDRAIYRPGQTVHVKGILYTDRGGVKERTVVTGKALKLFLKNANYQRIDTLNVTTNEFGSFEGEFKLPLVGHTGDFLIESSTRNGSVSFSVEEYKRPQFEVIIDELDKTYALGDEVQVSGRAQAYAGFKIDNATVKYTVTYRPYRKFYYSSKEVFVSQGETVTDANGKFNLSFPTKRADNSEMQVYIVHIDLVDYTGETHTCSRSFTLRNNRDFSLSIAFDALIEDQDERTWIIDLFAYDDTPIERMATVTISRLQTPEEYRFPRTDVVIDHPQLSSQEFYQHFPYLSYDNRDIKAENWPVEKKVWQQTVRTCDTTGIRLTPGKWEGGYYRIEAISTTPDGKKISCVEHFVVNLSNDPHQRQYEPLTLKLSSYRIEPGDTLHLRLGSYLKDIDAMLIIQCNDSIIHRAWHKLSQSVFDLDIPVAEHHRGVIVANAFCVQNDMKRQASATCQVPFTHKKLEIVTEHISDPLSPGSHERWQLRILNPDKSAANAELLALMYDASLDAFRSNDLRFSPYPAYTTKDIRINFSSGDIRKWNFSKTEYYSYVMPIHFLDYDFWMGDGIMLNTMHDRIVMATGAAGGKRMPLAKERSVDMVAFNGISESAEFNADVAMEAEEGQQEPVVLRSDFAETAFFYPQLHSDGNGDILIEFTTPEQLTRWKFLALAHTPDLKSAILEKSIESRQSLMVQPNRPRFLREHDTLDFAVKVVNLSEHALNGSGSIRFFNALTGEELPSIVMGNATLPFRCDTAGSALLSWRIAIPLGLSAITYKVTARAGDFADGEEFTLPVLPNRMLITETMPVYVNGPGNKRFTFDKLKGNTSQTLQHFGYTLEFTAAPAWYAVLALPYLMEYTYDCNEQIFSKIYANALASHIVNSNPKIKETFEQWKSDGAEVLNSPLERNEELKTLLLEETPWVRDAQDESQRRRAVGQLFDTKRISEELEKQVAKLRKAQNGDGSWSWFAGLPASQFVTQHIVAGFGHLRHLGVDIDFSLAMISKACKYLDAEMEKEYHKTINSEYWKKEKEYYFSSFDAHYLYARSFTASKSFAQKEFVQFYLKQAKEQVYDMDLYTQAVVALAFHRLGMEKEAADIAESIRQQAFESEEMGMYWKSNAGRYYSWNEAPIERQALFIEMFTEISPNTDEIEKMKVWLIKQKQTRNWSNTKATTEATYALLLRGEDLLDTDHPVTIDVGRHHFDLRTEKVEAGTGYFKTHWDGNEITPDMADVVLNKANKGPAYGSLYWQYFEELDKVTAADAGLSVEKTLYHVQRTPKGDVLTAIDENTPLAKGERVKVRLVLKSDRDLEYVHLKDMRAAAFEPTQVFTQCKYQGGIWYQEATRDAATNFFIPFLGKGSYVFEYELYVTQSGTFANGVASIECMYAPEFQAHSDGIRVEIR
jgi:Large extracellular alpha-helical protein